MLVKLIIAMNLLFKLLQFLMERHYYINTIGKVRFIDFGNLNLNKICKSSLVLDSSQFLLMVFTTKVVKNDSKIVISIY
jgi:hypothetical protein